MKRNILLTIAYDGSEYHGWQKQPRVRTVQGLLEQTMSRLFREEIILNGTSRTDAGVHAYGQRASFVTDIRIPIEKLALVVNNALCAREGRESGRGSFAKAPVRILKAEEMPENFHARFDCKGKKYIYKIQWNSDDMSLVFNRNYRYHVKEKLNLDAMNQAAQFLVGTHDFKSFEASGGNPRETTVRTVFQAEVQERTRTGTKMCERTKDMVCERTEVCACNEGEMEFHISGDGFLYNMVRIITGTLVEVGQGKRRPEEIKKIITAKDRTRAGHTAPPGGLYLAEVYYEQESCFAEKQPVIRRSGTSVL